MKIVDRCPLCGSDSLKTYHAIRLYEPILDDWIDKGEIVCFSCGAHVPVVFDGQDNPRPAWRNNKLFDAAMKQTKDVLSYLKRMASDSPNGFVDAEVVEGICMSIEETLRPWRCDDETEGKS